METSLKGKRAVTTERCATCDGKGYIMYGFEEDLWDDTATCPECGGTGERFFDWVKLLGDDE